MKLKVAFKAFLLLFFFSSFAYANEVSGADKLFSAVKSNYAEAVRYILSSGTVDVNALDKSGRSPLRLAIESKSSADIVRLLLSKGADINEKNRAGRSILDAALQVKSSPEVFQALLENKANLAERNKSGRTPLMLAVQKGLPVRTIYLFLQMGANPNAVDLMGMTPLMLAVEYDAPAPVVNVLLYAGADVRLTDKRGRSAYTLEKAKKEPDAQVLELFAAAFQKIRQNEEKRLTAANQPKAAAVVPKEEPVSVAITETPAGPEPIVISVPKLSRLAKDFLEKIHLSFTKVVIGLVILLFLFRKNMNWRRLADSEKVKNYKKAALKKVKKEKYEDVPPKTAPVKKKSDDEDEYDAFRTMHREKSKQDFPLIDAVKVSQPVTGYIKSLLKDGKNDINQADEDGKTALMYALEKNHSRDLVALLLDAGADINAKAKLGRTPLMFAARNNTHEDVLELLVERGGDVLASDEMDVSVLMFARNFNTNEKVIRYLIDLEEKLKSQGNAEAKGNASASEKASQSEKAQSEDAEKDAMAQYIEMENYFLNKAQMAASPAAAEKLNADGVAALNVEVADEGISESLEKYYITPTENKKDDANVTPSEPATPSVPVAQEPEELPLPAEEEEETFEFVDETQDIPAPVPEWSAVQEMPLDAASEETVPTPHQEKHVQKTHDRLKNPRMREKREAEEFGFEDDDFRSLLKDEISKTEKARQMLARMGIDALSRDGEQVTPLMKTLAEGGNRDLVAALIEAGAEINARDGNGASPLMYALNQTADLDTLEMLIKAGADVNARDKDSLTVLMKAVLYSQNPQIVGLLLSVGADPNARTEVGMSALMFSAGMISNAEIVSVLIKYGALVNEQAEDGMTALVFAARECSDPDIINILLDKGANAGVQNMNNKTAMDYAKDNAALQNTDAYWRLNDLSF